jgi:hypothetical protein
MISYFNECVITLISIFSSYITEKHSGMIYDDNADDDNGDDVLKW